MARAAALSLPLAKPRSRRASIALAIIGTIVLLLVVARLWLPTYLQDYVNRVLDANPEYGGEIGTVYVHLWRGAYEIDDVRIVKESGSMPVPFFSSPRVEFSIDWRALFHASLVGKVTIQQGALNFARSARGEVQTGEEGNWVQTVKALFPLRIDRLTLVDSRVLYHDYSESPPVRVTLTRINGAAENLTNSLDVSESLVAKFQANAIAEEHAPLYVRGSINPYTEKANFTLALELKALDLTRLNDALRAYGAVDAEQGQVSIYTEVDCKDNNFDGYLKVLLRDVHLVSLKSDSSNPLRLVWEALVAAVAEVFTNQPRDQIATRIPIEGSFESPETDTLSGLASMVRNAFIEALKPGFEQAG